MSNPYIPQWSATTIVCIGLNMYIRIYTYRGYDITILLGAVLAQNNITSDTHYNECLYKAHHITHLTL